MRWVISSQLFYENPWKWILNHNRVIGGELKKDWCKVL